MPPKDALGLISEKQWLLDRARAIGFDSCGVVRAERFPELDSLPEWLRRGYAGEMRYLHDPRRADVRSALPAARSVIVCAVNYNTDFPLSILQGAQEESAGNALRGWISRYAWGEDYHQVLWSMLNQLAESLRERFGSEILLSAYADTGPISERTLARHAGLGWIGKNTLLLNQRLGSWFFLGAIVTSLELEPARPSEDLLPPDLCGTCRKCIDACPTEALVEPYVMDARRCIAYLTIELRGPIPEEFREAMGTHVYGCDICQDVCPWNRKAPVTNKSSFLPRNISGSGESLFHPRLETLLSLTEDLYRASFRKSSMKRAKFAGLIRNACIAAGNAVAHSRDVPERLLALLRKHAESSDRGVSESAQWALSRIKRKTEKAKADEGALG